MTFKKGQYVACKYRGTNGDLIVGRIESVRSSGHVVLVNMLTGKSSLKKASVLAQRNQVVAASEAKDIASARDKAEARALAVRFTNYVPMSEELRAALLLYHRLPQRDQERFINSVVGRHGTFRFAPTKAGKR